MEKVIELEDVWVRYGNQIILEAVNLELKEPNGLLGIIDLTEEERPHPQSAPRLLKPYKGNVKIFGKPPEKAEIL